MQERLRVIEVLEVVERHVVAGLLQEAGDVVDALVVPRRADRAGAAVVVGDVLQRRPGTFCPATPFTDSEYANVSIANAIRSLLIPSTGEEGTFEP